MAEPSARRALKRKLWLGPLALILAVWVLLYLPHLRTSPSWYGDETLALTCALDLVHGAQANRCLWNTFWNPGSPFQPGYLVLIGGASQLFGGDILGARLVNTLMALAIACLIYFQGRRLLGHLPALLSALLFLTYEQTVIHFRWTFTHNLIALGFTIMVLALARRSRLRANLTAGLGLALGALSYPLFVYGLVPAFLLRLKRPSAWFWLFTPPALVVGLSLLLGSRVPDLWGDLAATLHFYTKSSAENSGSLVQIAFNCWIFFTADAWHILGFVCFLACLNRRFYAVGVSGLVIALLLLQNRQNLSVFYYQAVILLPLMMLAYGGALRRAILWLRKKDLRKTFLRRAQYALLAVPLCSGLALLPQSLSGKLKPRIAYWTVQSIGETEAAARWLNDHTTPADLVICHANLAWLLRARTADLPQAVSWAGYPTWPFETPLPKAQFRYDADLKKAAYVVISDIDQRWTFLQPNVDKLIQILQDEHWPVAWSGENIIIFTNPTPARTTPTPTSD